MVLANLLQHKGTGYYYYLNDENKVAINFHLQNNVWFDEYDKYYNADVITNPEIGALEEVWFDFVNSFDNIEAFAPHLEEREVENIYFVHYNKGTAIYNNKRFYEFNPTREIKKLLKDNIEKGIIDAFLLYKIKDNG